MQKVNREKVHVLVFCCLCNLEHVNCMWNAVGFKSHSKFFMTRITVLFVLTFFISGCGESKIQNATGEDLAQVEKEWMYAMMKRDQSRLDEIVAPEFTVTGMNFMDSAAVTRGMWMQNVMQDMEIDSVHFIKTKVNTIGDVGIVRAQFYWSGTYGDDRFSDTTSLIDTWINRGGWRVVSRIMTE